jgi:hypothetical protein
MMEGTNSTPPGTRLANNAFITRKGKSIKQDDQTQITYDNNYTPTEQKDSDGQDITAQAIANTKYANNPSVASLTTLSGSILKQLQEVDPKNINAVLPQAIPAFLKMKDLNTFSSGEGSLGVMGQALGMALQSVSSIIGQAPVINNIASAVSSGTMSNNLASALSQALLSLNSPIITSDTVSNVINMSLQNLINLLTPLLKNGTLTLEQLESIISLFLQEIQDNGSQAVLGQGATFGNIFNMMQTLLPTIAQPIENSLNIHFPESVFDISKMTTALQNFTMNQSFLKAPENGRKALANQAVSQVVPPGQSSSLSDILGNVEGVTQSTITSLQNGLNNVIQVGTN